MGVYVNTGSGTERAAATSDSGAGRSVQVRGAGFDVTLGAVQSPPFRLGTTATHIESTADIGETEQQAMMTATLSLINQHIVGFGLTDAVQPTEGASYDFTAMDTRMATLAAPGVELMITFCGAPAWMSVGDTIDGVVFDASSPYEYVPPHPDFMDDWVALCAAIADRYDGTSGRPNVTRFQVWNELKRYYSSSLGRWWYEGYIAMYDAVRAGVLAVRPGVDIGGPYPVLGTHSAAISSEWTDVSEIGAADRRYDDRPLEVVRQWLATSDRSAADTVLIDVKNHHNQQYEEVNLPTPGDPWTAMGIKLNELRVWINDLDESAPMVGISEWYAINRVNGSTTGQSLSHAGSIAAVSETDANLTTIVVWSIIDTIWADIDWALMWQLQGSVDDSEIRWPLGLWKENLDETALVAPLTWLKANVYGRSDVRKVTSLHADINGIAGNSKLLLVSKSATSIDVVTDAGETTVPGYGIVYLDLD